MGYTGGTTPNPLYTDLGDHTETVQLDYDPSVITFRGLVESFLEAHDAFSPADSRQYMSAVFYHDEEQQRVALEVLARAEADAGRAIQTEVLPTSVFYPAEDYHQRYLQKRGLDRCHI